LTSSSPRRRRGGPAGGNPWSACCPIRPFSSWKIPARGPNGNTTHSVASGLFVDASRKIGGDLRRGLLDTPFQVASRERKAAGRHGWTEHDHRTCTRRLPAVRGQVFLVERLRD